MQSKLPCVRKHSTDTVYQKEMAENKMWVLVRPGPSAAVTAETAKCSICLKVYTNS